MDGRDGLKPLSITFRMAAAVLFLLSLLTIAITLFQLRHAAFNLGDTGSVFLCLYMAVIMGQVAFTGFAPGHLVNIDTGD